MPSEKTSWTSERVARLGFLVGQGFGARRIAEDPLIASTPNNVHRQAQRFGLAFRDRDGDEPAPDAGGRRPL